MSYSILQINTSPLGEHSISRKLTTKIITDIKASCAYACQVIERDLAIAPLPHLSGITVGAFFTPPDQRSDIQNESLKLSDQLIDELFVADLIVIGAPMWNLGIPSSLKAWIDHIIRAGRTFQYGASGPESLLPLNKKVIIASSRGGVYTSGPRQTIDYQEAYLKTVLAFIGLHDVSIVRAEGVSMGEEAVKAAMLSADAQLVDTIRNLA